MGHQKLNPSLSYIFQWPFQSTLSGSIGPRNDDSFPYDQPPLTELLIMLSFLFLLNVFRVVADFLMNGGIIAEIALGMVYGAPLANILSVEWESTFTVLGYLGLIGIIFEGGLATNLPLLLANLPLSISCAVTGVAVPVALSFALLSGGYGYTRLEAFASGAALASTSLGTTLMALNSVSRGSSGVGSSKDDLPQEEGKVASNVVSTEELNGHNKQSPLQDTRIGTVLISAAIIDDVIGLILSSVIPALSATQSQNTGDQPNQSITWVVIRPLLSSFLMALVTLLFARFILKPLFWWRRCGERWCSPRRAEKPWGPNFTVFKTIHRSWGMRRHADAVKLILMVLFVSAFSSIAYYTRSSVLYGAYLAGLTLTYMSRSPDGSAHRQDSSECDRDPEDPLSFHEAYGRNVGPLQNHILAPLFFASIGYAVPFESLWKPAVLWRGVVYATLMATAKITVGIPIILWSVISWPDMRAAGRSLAYSLPVRRTVVCLHRKRTASARAEGRNNTGAQESPRPWAANAALKFSALRASVAPAAFMGTAMVARGEIGLLIAQVARGPGPLPGNPTSGSGGLLSEEPFLVCMWAILLCTFVGPIGMGFIVCRWETRLRMGMWA